MSEYEVTTPIFICVIMDKRTREGSINSPPPLLPFPSLWACQCVYEYMHVYVCMSVCETFFGSM